VEWAKKQHDECWPDQNPLGGRMAYNSIIEYLKEKGPREYPI